MYFKICLVLVFKCSNSRMPSCQTQRNGDFVAVLFFESPDVRCWRARVQPFHLAVGISEAGRRFCPTPRIYFRDSHQAQKCNLRQSQARSCFQGCWLATRPHRDSQQLSRVQGRGGELRALPGPGCPVPQSHKTPGKFKIHELLRMWHFKHICLVMQISPPATPETRARQQSNRGRRPKFWTPRVNRGFLNCLEGQGETRGADSPWALQFLQIGRIPFRALGDRSHKPCECHTAALELYGCMGCSNPDGRALTSRPERTRGWNPSGS
jgi:hypothetical protein